MADLPVLEGKELPNGVYLTVDVYIINKDGNGTCAMVSNLTAIPSNELIESIVSAAIENAKEQIGGEGWRPMTRAEREFSHGPQQGAIAQ